MTPVSHADKRIPLQPFDSHLGLPRHSAAAASPDLVSKLTVPSATTSSILLQDTSTTVTTSATAPKQAMPSTTDFEDQAISFEYDPSYNRASELYSSVLCEPYTRILDRPTILKDQAFWPIFNYKNNCIIISAQRADINAEHKDKILDSELITSYWAANVIWKIQMDKGEKKCQKLWISHISVVPGDIRLLRYFWTPKNHIRFGQASGYDIQYQVSFFSQRNIAYHVPIDWVLECITDEVKLAFECERRNRHHNQKGETDMGYEG